MVALDTAAKREGHKAMEKALTAAANVRRAFKAGPPRRKDAEALVTDFNPDNAVVAAWALCNDLQSAMERSGLLRADAQAALVVLTPNATDEGQETIYVYRVPDMPGLPALFEKVKALQRRTNVFPLGVVFRQFDRESDRAEVWAVPWLVFQSASAALSNVRQCFEDLGHVEEILFHQAKQPRI